jgi:hypothetical protein
MAHDRSGLERHNGVASDRSARHESDGRDSRCEWNASQCGVFLSVLAAAANGSATEA